MFIPFPGSFGKTGLSMFMNFDKDVTEWTEEDQLNYLKAKMDETTMKELELNEEIEGEEIEDEEIEDENCDKLSDNLMTMSVGGKKNVQKSKKRKNKEAVKADTQAKITKFFKLNK